MHLLAVPLPCLPIHRRALTPPSAPLCSALWRPTPRPPRVLLRCAASWTCAGAAPWPGRGGGQALPRRDAWQLLSLGALPSPCSSDCVSRLGLVLCSTTGRADAQIPATADAKGACTLPGAPVVTGALACSATTTCDTFNYCQEIKQVAWLDESCLHSQLVACISTQPLAHSLDVTACSAGPGAVCLIHPDSPPLYTYSATPLPAWTPPSVAGSACPSARACSQSWTASTPALAR